MRKEIVKNYKELKTMSESFIDQCAMIDENVRVMVIIEGPDISCLDCTSTMNKAEQFGLVALTKIRLEETERFNFHKRACAQEEVDALMSIPMDNTKAN